MNKFWVATIVIAVFTWYSFFGVFNRDYTIRLKDVDQTVTKYTMIAGKKGMLYQSVFDEFVNDLRRHGNFEIYLKAEKYDGGATPTTLEGYDVIGQNLRELGYDTITITVISSSRHLLSIVSEFNILGTANGQHYDFRLVGKSCSFIK